MVVIERVAMGGWAIATRYSRGLGQMWRWSWPQQPLGRWPLWALLLALWLPLTACGGPQPPSDGVIEQALRQQFEQVQQDLRSQLAAPKDTPSELRLSRIEIDHSRRSRLGDRTIYQIDGTYRLSGRYLGRSSPRRSPFKISLQQLADGSWQLVSPAAIAPPL